MKIEMFENLEKLTLFHSINFVDRFPTEALENSRDVNNR